jgi:hypothetical protein
VRGTAKELSCLDLPRSPLLEEVKYQGPDAQRGTMIVRDYSLV